ncbi:MAG: STAS domain-containing protein [Pseudomonadota bacterium]
MASVDSTMLSRELTIAVSGRFDFSTHDAFRRSYQELQELPESVLVDLKDATYVDSSALGMLLLLRDYAGGDDARVAIENCNEDVKKILALSNFEQLFEIR